MNRRDFTRNIFKFGFISAVAILFGVKKAEAAYYVWYSEGAGYCKLTGFCAWPGDLFKKQRLYYCPNQGSCYPTSTTSEYWTGRCCYAG